MTTRPIYTDINAANAEIRDMETHMNVMKRMISTQSERIENFKDLVEVLKKQIESHATLRESHLKLMEVVRIGLSIYLGDGPLLRTNAPGEVAKMIDSKR